MTTPTDGRSSEQSLLSAGLTAVGGALLVVSAFLRWVGSGAGSTLSLRDLGDLLLSDRFGVVSRWFGAIAYVVPLCGGVAIVAAGLSRRAARRVAAVLCLVVGLFVVGGATVFGGLSAGPGWWVATVGLGFLLTGAMATRTWRSSDSALPWTR